MVALFLVSCATTEKTHRDIPAVPYQFKIATYQDEREDNLANLVGERQTFPFRQGVFASSLLHALNRNMFVSDEARVDVVLKDYASVKEEGKYLVSYYMQLTAHDMNGQLLAEGNFSCLSEGTTDFWPIWEEGRKNVSSGMSLKQLRLWEELTRDCLMQVAADFNAQILAKAAADE